MISRESRSGGYDKDVERAVFPRPFLGFASRSVLGYDVSGVRCLDKAREAPARTVMGTDSIHNGLSGKRQPRQKQQAI